MTDVNWVQVGAALAGGGAVGALINVVVSNYRSRRQPVGTRIDVLPVFRTPGEDSNLRAEIAIASASGTKTFRNLFLASVQVVNRGNRDLTDFPFGVTLGAGDRCIHVDAIAPDRHHGVTNVTPATPDQPSEVLDFRLTPFNRGDLYQFKLYLVIPCSCEKPKDIVLGSSSPVRFVELPTMSEIIAAAMSSMDIKLGIVRIHIP